MSGIRPEGAARAIVGASSDSAAVLRLLACGWTVRRTADATTWTRQAVVRLASRYGLVYDPGTDTVQVTAGWAARR